jgi:hypothetical protein
LFPSKNAIKINDRREGFGHFHLTFAGGQLNVSLNSGYNCLIFCGTSQVDALNDTLMCERFGRKRIKIEPVDEFIARAKECIGAFQARIYDVVYRDIQNYSAEFPSLQRIFGIVGKGNLSRESLHKLHEEYFEVFYEHGLLPGLYCKPKRYSDERERRLIFETTRDIRTKPIIINDETLLEFIIFLGE